MFTSIQEGYQPGIVGRITELHADYYSRNWGFGKFFEAKVAGELAAFLNYYDSSRDGIWSVSHFGRIEGSIVIDGIHAADEGTHLRWFILAEHLKGKKLGDQLIQKALDFCRSAAYPKIFLWTFKGLNAAHHLYEKYGFRLEYQNEGSQWGKQVIEQKLILNL